MIVRNCLERRNLDQVMTVNNVAIVYASFFLNTKLSNRSTQKTIHNNVKNVTSKLWILKQRKLTIIWNIDIRGVEGLVL